MVIYKQNSDFSISVDTLGAQLLSLKDKTGREYLWQRDPAFWPRSSPILFPSIGVCRNNRTAFEGSWYPMPKHGFGRDEEFFVSSQTDESVTMELSWSQRTKTMYPYEFSLSLSYKLTERGLSVDYRVQNLQDKDMPYCLGAHPGFLCPLNPGERFEDYRLEFEYEETMASIPYNLETLELDVTRPGLFLNHSRVLPLSYDLFREDAVYFENPRSRKVALVHPQTRKGVEVRFPDFDGIAFWTPMEGGARLLCIEPWNGADIRSDEDDEFFHKHHIRLLSGFQPRTHHLEINIL